MNTDGHLRPGHAPSIPLGRAMVFFLGLSLGAAPLAGQQRQRADSTRDSSRVVLEPIRIAVSRSSRPLSDVPFSVSRLTADDLRRGRATLGLDEALVEVPGVHVSNRYNASLDQRISIRGFGARSAFGVRGVKVLIDGIPQTLPDGQGQLTNLDLASVGSIEVLRGTASALYGNASGGVIDIRTAVANPTRSTGQAQVVAGAFGAAKVSGGVSMPAGRGTLAVDAAYTRANGYREHSESEVRQASVRFRQDLGRRTALIVSGHLADAPQLDNPGSLNQGELDTDPAQANPGNVGANAGKAVSQGQAGVTLRHQLANGHQAQITAYGLYRDLDNPLSFAYITLARSALGVRGTVSANLGRSANAPVLTAGVDLQRQRDDRLNRTTDSTTITRNQLETVLEIGPFAQLTADLGPWVTATVGGRFDRLLFRADDRLLSDGDDTGRRIMNAFSGTAGLVLHAAPGVEPFVNLSTGFESPTTTELANRPTGPGGFNPDLEPQRSTTIEGGIRATAGPVSLGGSVFYTRVRDALIPFEVPTDPGRRFFRNAGSARHAGFEADLSWTLAEQATVKSAYNFADYAFDEFRTADEVFDGNRLPGIPTHQWYGSVRLTPGGGVFATFDHTIRSSVYANDANDAMVDAYGTTGIRVGVERVAGGYTVTPFVGMLNATDRTYVGSVVVNAGFGRYFEPAPGRNAYAGLSITPRR